jgi:signal transduction histidine kinase
MSSVPIRLLLVEDNPADARLLQHALADAPGQSFHVAHVELIADALAHLASDPFDAILLDLSLPDSQSLNTLSRVMAAAPHLPIVVMTGFDDEARALEAVRAGAQDFLIKGRGDGRLLVRSIRYAMERKQAEQQLKMLNETLEQRVAERTAVATHRAAQLQVLASELTLTEHRERRRLAQILHDHLQQLLYAARLTLGSLQRHGQSEPLEEETIARVDKLLEQSLDVSRSLTVELSPPVLYEAGLAAALEWLGRYMQETCGLTVVVEADPHSDPESEDLCILLFAAARELLFNVMKHAHTETAHVRMRATPKGEVQVVVSDEGSGLNPAKLKEERATTSGFGLFSIRERLQLLGGSLEVDSAPGEGTRVTVSAPRRLPALAAVEPSAAEQPAADSTEPAATDRHPAHGRKTRVLLADDEQTVREDLACLLRQQADIEVVAVADSGQMAVDLAIQKRPDVVVLSVAMSDLGGVEVTRRLTALIPGLRVIGLSMHEEEDVALTMRAAGAATYLTKGGSPEALIAAVRGHARPSHKDHYHDYRQQTKEPRQETSRPAGR